MSPTNQKRQQDREKARQDRLAAQEKFRRERLERMIRNQRKTE